MAVRVPWGASRRCILRAMALAPMALAPVAALAQAQAPRRKAAMWVWGEPVLSPGGMAALADRRDIGTLFVYVSPDAARALLAGQRQALDAVAAMRRHRRRVYAVAGEPDWARGPAELPGHAALLVRLATRTALFDGLHFDVEPNAAPGWNEPSPRQALIAGTLRFYEAVAAAAPGVAIDAAANPAFAGMAAEGGDFMRGLASRVRSVSIMAYRSSVPKAMEWAAPAVAQVTAVGRPWRLGVLVDPDPAEPGASWQGASPGTFAAAMRQLDAAAAMRFAHSNYAGLVFESYAGLSAMEAAKRPP